MFFRLEEHLESSVILKSMLLLDCLSEGVMSNFTFYVSCLALFSSDINIEEVLIVH